VAGELNSTVTVCRWRDGELATTQVVDTLLKPPAENAVAEVLLSADGRFVYVGNRGDNSTAVFETADDGASLNLVDAPPCGGDGPRHTTIDPTGRWLYVANQQSGEVVWFELDAGTGLPAREAGRVPATAVTHVLFV
jgi:6-phosphogluconolactonase (cycloisomerase 2 family)